ncbi:zeta toxin family protein [Undibacterium sp. TC4M20W]|uniref:zeta toxin family protein n=1 Tax=Undibacterium sp. TC4M20W TaxID=3413052 RepID=UPI003BF208B0
MSERPIALFYGGTNGSGKSTLREIDSGSKISKHIDPDAIARVINPQDPRAVDVAAGREAIHQFKQALAAKTSFTMETTLTGNGILRRMEEAKAAGFQVQLRYVGLNSADVNVERVANRVSKGGHHIDEDVIRRRYTESQENLVGAVAICDKTLIRDNSGAMPVTYLKIENNQITKLTDKEAPNWIKSIETKIVAGMHPSQTQSKSIEKGNKIAAIPVTAIETSEKSEKSIAIVNPGTNVLSVQDSPSNRMIAAVNESTKLDRSKP